MSQKSGPAKLSSERIVRDIRRATRKQYSAEEKIRIVLDGLRGEHSVAELCRREGIAESLYYTWSKEFLEAGKRRLAGDIARAATSGEVKDLRRQAQALKEVVAEQALELRLLKKSMITDGADEERDIRLPKSWRSSGWSSNRIYRCVGCWRSSASLARPFIDGTISIRPAAQRPWRTDPPGRSASGTASLTRCVVSSCNWPWRNRSYRHGSWPRALPTRKATFVSEASVYRLLKDHDLIASPAYIVMKAADEFKDKTTAPNQLWQTDFTYLKVTGWGWFYLSTILDDFSRYIIAWKLCTTMNVGDVTQTLDLALQASGVDRAKVVHRPRLLSDNGPSYISAELAEWLDERNMGHVRGAPCHPQTQGKIER